VRRLFVDGLGGMLESATRPERIGRFVAALANELRGLGVTTLMTAELRRILGPEVDFPIDGVSSLSEAMLVLRYAEVDAAMRRVAAVTKIRDSDFDPRLHAYEITGAGIRVLGPYRERYEQLMMGSTHARVAPPAGSPSGEG
jgi:circadian clock protein KaiC